MESAPADRPTRARFTVLAYLCAMSFVLYLDRVCMSQAVNPILEEFDLSRTEMSLIMMSFTLAYGLFEIPTGRMGDRQGVRRVLTRIVVWWSAFTALTGACWGFWSLLVVRFLFGAGEAGAYPNAAKVFARWFPQRERGRAQGLMLACGLIGGSASPTLVAYLIRGFGWRAAFICFGSLGVIWAIAFLRWFRDDPADHPAANLAERELIGASGPSRQHSSIPWRAVFRNRSIWLLGLITSLNSFVSYVYFSWYSDYLQSTRVNDQLLAGQLASLVLAGGAAGLLGGGIVADLLSRWFVDPGRARRRFCTVTLVVAATCLGLAVQAESPLLSATLTALSFFSMMCQQSTWWSSAIQVSGSHIGSLFGLMNGLGVVGAMSSQFFFGRFVDWRKAHGYLGRDQWDPAFWVCALAMLLAGLIWFGVNVRRRIDDVHTHSPASGIGGSG